MNSKSVTSLQARALAQLDPAQAETWLAQGVEGNGRSLTYFELCRLYWQEGRQDEAVAACQAGEISATYWVNIGLAAEQEQDFELALKAYETAVAVDPQLALGWFRLGHMRSITQAYDQVAAAHQQALASGYPPQSSIYEEIGRAYLQLDNLAAAKKAFDEGLHLFPDSRPLYLDMVSVFRQEKDWQMVDIWLALLLQAWPEDGNAWAMRGELAMQQDDPTNALAYYQKATSLQPNPLSAWAGVAQAATKLDDISLATTAYEQLLALQPAQSGFWLQAGEFFLKYDQPPKARAAFEQVLILEPTNQQAQDRLDSLTP